jgi:hypothetical protein
MGTTLEETGREATGHETAHFFIEHHPRLSSPYSIMPKAHTQAESDKHGYMLPHVGGFAAGNTAEELVARLHQAEAWYVGNRAKVISSRQSTSTSEERRARYAAFKGRSAAPNHTPESAMMLAMDWAMGQGA